MRGHRDENGKRRQKWHGPYTRKKDAEAALNELTERVRSGSYVATAKTTVREFLVDQWLVLTAISRDSSTMFFRGRNMVFQLETQWVVAVEPIAT